MNEQTTQGLATITLELTHELLRRNNHRKLTVMARHLHFYVCWKGMNVTLDYAPWGLRTQALYVIRVNRNHFTLIFLNWYLQLKHLKLVVRFQIQISHQFISEVALWAEGLNFPLIWRMFNYLNGLLLDKFLFPKRDSYLYTASF